MDGSIILYSIVLNKQIKSTNQASFVTATIEISSEIGVVETILWKEELLTFDHQHLDSPNHHW